MIIAPHFPASLVNQSCLTLCDPMDCSSPPLSLGFFRQEYWSGLPFPPPGDLPNPGSEPASPVSPALQADSLPAELLGKSIFLVTVIIIWDSHSNIGKSIRVHPLIDI